MNTDELIEQIHAANAECRGGERRRTRRLAWRIALPSSIAAAAVLLLLLWPRGNDAQAAAQAGVYCNSQCNPDDVMALIDDNINHIKEIKSL